MNSSRAIPYTLLASLDTYSTRLVKLKLCLRRLSLNQFYASNFSYGRFPYRQFTLMFVFVNVT